MDVTFDLIAIGLAVFFAAGFVDSIAGGGGLITLPALLLCGLPPHMILGTNKFSTTLGTLAAFFSYLRSGLVEKSIAPVGFGSAFLGGAAGSGLALCLDNAVLGKVLLFMLPVGIVISLMTGFGKKERPLEKTLLGLKVFLIGFPIGVYDGFFGPGTGSFMIIALNIVLGLGLVRASATTKVMNLASNAGALCSFAAGGVVLYPLAIPCALANIAGNLCGAHLAVRVGARAGACSSISHWDCFSERSSGAILPDQASQRICFCGPSLYRLSYALTRMKMLENSVS